MSEARRFPLRRVSSEPDAAAPASSAAIQAVRGGGIACGEEVPRPPCSVSAPARMRLVVVRQGPRPGPHLVAGDLVV